MKTIHLAKHLLTELGHTQPTKKQIDLLMNVLSITTCELPVQLSLNERLSPPEISCLYLIAKGHSTVEVANLLHIAVATVKTHRATILRKLSCSTIAQAVFEGVRFGHIQNKNAIHA